MFQDSDHGQQVRSVLKVLYETGYFHMGIRGNKVAGVEIYAG